MTVETSHALFEQMAEVLGLAEESSDRPDSPEQTDQRSRVVITLQASPEGDVTMAWPAQEGPPTPPDRSTDVTDVDVKVHIVDGGLELTMPWKEAIVIGHRVTPPAVSYMQGRLKVSGDMGGLIAMLKRASAAGPK